MEHCRLCNCMKLREFCENIFDNKQTDPTIPTIVELFTNLKIVENDPYTKFVCFNCFNILIIFYHYRERVLETNELLLKNEINTNRNNVEDFHKNWLRIKHCDDGQFVVYNNDSDDDCKTNLRIGGDSEDGDNQPLSTLIDDNKKIINYNNDGNLHDNNSSNITANESSNDKLSSTIATTSDENQGDHKNSRISSKPLDIKKETTGNNNNDNNSDIDKINEQQTGKKRHQCNICGKNFVRNGGLKEHLLIHKGEKPHQCYICGNRFRQFNILKRHFLKHTDEKAHECNICHKRYKDIKYLKRHLEVHTGEKPHQCNICNMRFSIKMYLKSHLKTHSDEKAHQCHICEKKFNYKKSLERHLKIHTGEKPHQCDICYKRFLQKNNLKIHLKVHKGEKTLPV